ncbi:hypothetical protein Trydic_g1715 [Trypoxylus dichotomus]
MLRNSSEIATFSRWRNTPQHQIKPNSGWHSGIGWSRNMVRMLKFNSDFHLLEPLKKLLTRKCFTDQKQLLDTVVNYFKLFDKQQYRERTTSWCYTRTDVLTFSELMARNK